MSNVLVRFILKECYFNIMHVQGNTAEDSISGYLRPRPKMVGSAISDDEDEVVLCLTKKGSEIAGNDKYQVHNTFITL